MSKYNLIDIIESTLGKFMDTKMEEEEEKKLPMDENEEAVDLAIEVSQEKAGINEVRIDRDVAERIEGLTNIELKRKFLFAFEDLYVDLVEDDPFYPEDVVNHLSNEMHKHLSSLKSQGNKLGDESAADIPGFEGTMDALDNLSIREDSYEERKGKALYPILKAGANATGDEVEMYVKSLAKDIELNGKEQYKDFKSDDFVEDFKNYIADKSLQEHFKRFM